MTPTTASTMKTKPIDRNQPAIRCNVNHSGNHKVTYDLGHWLCQGCESFCTEDAVRETLAELVKDINGSGGLVRIK